MKYGIVCSLLLVVVLSGDAYGGSLKVTGAARTASRLQNRWQSPSSGVVKSSGSGSSGISKLRDVALPIRGRAGVLNFLRDIDCNLLKGAKVDICFDVLRHLDNRTASFTRVGRFTSPYRDRSCSRFFDNAYEKAACNSILPYAHDKDFMLLWSTLGALGYVVDLDSNMVYE